MDAYPGLPGPRFSAIVDHEQSRSRYGNKSEFYLGMVEMPGNVGTYLDSPFHRYLNGSDLSQIPLERVAGLQGVVLDAGTLSERPVTIPCEEAQLRGKAVLIRTGWDRQWGTPRYWEPGPFLSSEMIELFVRAKPILVGVDFWNVDDTNDPARPAHTRLLAANILIVEHMCNLSSLPLSGFVFNAVPLRIVKGASFPVRAFAEIDGGT